ncbi:MAG: tetratricopeptide repeat protein, partial [Myxococcales bacterium]|nr:tetratricopeptide repeat protein [Myxococcales bacterium]
GQPEHAIEWAPFALAAAARARKDGAEIDGIVGEALRDAGRYLEAKTRLARALASKDPLRGDRRALILVNVGSVELALGAPAAAEKSFTDALAAATAQLGDGHPTLAIYYDKLAASARALGRIPDALALHERSLAVRTAAYGADDRSTASSYLHRARTLLEAKRLDEALADAKRAEAIRSTQLGPTSARLGEVIVVQGDIALAAGDKAAALALYTRAGEIDPRIDLIARRAAAGADIPLDALPVGLDPLTADRAAALALRVAKLPPAEGAALAAQLLDRFRALPRPVDPALAKAIADALHAANNPAAEEVLRR